MADPSPHDRDPAPGLRILHLVAQSHARGAERVALELADELDALGHDDRVVALTAGVTGGEDARLEPLVRRTGLRPDVRIQCAWRLRALLRRDPVDLILAHGGLPVQVAAMSLPRGGPLIVWQRILDFPPEFWRPIRRRMWAGMLRRVAAAVALTSDEAVELRQIGFEGPVWVIPNFRQPERFSRVDRTVESQRLRAELGLDGTTPLIGFVGHLVDQKRPDRALDVLARVHAAGQPAHLVVAGDGPLRTTLEKAARARGLDGHVRILGHRDDVEHIFGGVDVVVLTSDSEGIPGVAIEGLMAGCPIVSFPLGGVTEVVEDGVTGFVLSEPDVAVMADRVVELVRDDALSARMSAEARNRRHGFSASATAQRYDARLRALMAHDPVVKKP